MTDLTEMWVELERYQPYADKHGFGEVWKQMCEERTAWAARQAAWAADAAVAASRAASRAAGAAWAAEAAVAASRAAAWVQLAIENIREAIEKEQEQT